MGGFLFADAAQPQQAAWFFSAFVYAQCESVESDTVCDNAGQRTETMERPSLCLRDAAERNIGGDIFKQMWRVEMPGQMQGRKQRSVELHRSRPEAAGHIVH